MNEEMKKIIRTATLELLKKKDYKDIQMKEIADASNIGRRTLYRYFACKDDIMDDIVEDLMDSLANTINEHSPMTLEGIAYSYFLFCQDNSEELRLLKKAHLMYLLEDNLPTLIAKVAVKTKYKDKSAEEIYAIRDHATMLEKYNYYYMLAGYFKVAQMWMEEEERISPEEMTSLLIKIVKREF